MMIFIFLAIFSIFGADIASHLPNKAFLEYATVLTPDDIEILNNAAGLEDGQEQNVLEKLDYLNFVKEAAGDIQSGYTDKYQTFKLEPKKGCFGIYIKENGAFRCLGNLKYPKGCCAMPESITIAQDGLAFAAIFKIKNKNFLYVWRQTDNFKQYRRYVLGYLDSVAISNDGKVILAYSKKHEKLYYWIFNGKKYKKITTMLTGTLGNKVLLGLNLSLIHI